MCLVLPARVLAVHGGLAEVELHDGQHAMASTELVPDLSPGLHVLVDRGMVLRVIEPDEAEAILAIYAEMEQLLDEAPAHA